MRTVFVVAVVLALVANQATAITFDHVAAPLSNLQDATTGGFRSTFADPRPSVQATAAGLFISSLYGLEAEIRKEDVSKYLGAVENSDAGYGRTYGEPSSLDSTSHALEAYAHLGMAAPSSANVISFIRSVFDPETKLFADRAGGRGRVKSSAQALEILTNLGGTSDPKIQSEFLPALASVLKGAAAGDHFEFDHEASAMEANCYGIRLAALTDKFNSADAAKFADYIVARQNTVAGSPGAGGFFADADKTVVNIEATAAAVSALSVLSEVGKKDFVSSIDSAALLGYCRGLRLNLVTAALAHRAVAATDKFTDLLTTEVAYEVVEAPGRVLLGDQIIQGTHVRPHVAVTFEALSNTKLEVELTVTLPSGEPVATSLDWNAAADAYVSPSTINTAGQLGEIVFNYKLSAYVVGIGDISWSVTETKMVGYGIDVAASAAFAGKQIAEGESIGVGTAFDFAVKLFTDKGDLTTGDFVVSFSVVDSSRSTLHSESVAGATNTGSISFKYELNDASVPAGEIFFEVAVAPASSPKAVHTSATTAYVVNVPMVAAQISFEGAAGSSPTYKLGDNVVVSITPGSLPDLRTVHAYDYSDAVAARKFDMVVSTPQGAVVATVPGTVSNAKGKAKYTFKLSVAPTLDSLGTNEVSFVYKTESGASIVLENFNSATNELWDNASPLGFTIDAALYVTDVEEMPVAGDFFYGNEIKFRFAVKDAVSGKLVGASAGGANIFLTLAHAGEGSKRTVSTRVPAVEVTKADGSHAGFAIEWTINPNTVKGAGVLDVTAINSDGDVVPLFKDSSKKERVSLNVNIGGEITVSSQTYSVDDELLASKSTFVTEFMLFCQGKSLRDAQLRARVRRTSADGSADEELFRLPVALTPDGEKYSVSWVVPHSQASAGTYTLAFYREVDRVHTSKSREFLEKKRAKDRALGLATDEDDAADAAAEADVNALFEVVINHEGNTAFRLPLDTKVLVMFLFLGGWLAAYFQRSSL